MAKSSKLRVMISSKCRDSFPLGAKNPRLSDTRRELKSAIEALEIGGQSLFEVWINEDAAPQGGSWDSWDVCLKAVEECDIFIALSNGDAGWGKESESVGICHAELMTALNTAPAKVRLIALPNVAATKGVAGQRNALFQDYVSTQSLFRGDNVSTIGELKTRVFEALHDAVIKLTQSGVRDASRGKFHSGAPLDWTRMDFLSRQKQMIRSLQSAFSVTPGTALTEGRVTLHIGDHEVLCVLSAIPAALSVAAARELVGQPFLRDHLPAESFGEGLCGPLHLIACQKSATEAQATKLLGFPDAMVVSAPFGVFVADPVQMVQFAFLVNCRDDTSTRHGAQRFLEWLRQTGEDARVAVRAQSRSRIIAAIATEVEAARSSLAPPKVRAVTSTGAAKKRGGTK